TAHPPAQRGAGGQGLIANYGIIKGAGFRAFLFSRRYMAIPDYQTLMLPLLKYVDDGREYFFRDIVEDIADQFKLTQEEREELLPSGASLTFTNRLGWARTYLKKAGLVEQARRGYVNITK